MACCKFLSGSGVVDICISPTLNFCGGKLLPPERENRITVLYVCQFLGFQFTVRHVAIVCWGSSRVVHASTWGCNLKHDNHDGAGIDRQLHDPIEDQLVPLEPLDLSKVHSIDDLVRAMSKTAFTGRQLGEAADVLEAMARDKDCFVVMTLAGAMTVAKQGLVDRRTDRPRHRECDRLDRRADGARTGRGHRARAFPLQP